MKRKQFISILAAGIMSISLLGQTVYSEEAFEDAGAATEETSYEEASYTEEAEGETQTSDESGSGNESTDGSDEQTPSEGSSEDGQASETPSAQEQVTPTETPEEIPEGGNVVSSEEELNAAIAATPAGEIRTLILKNDIAISNTVTIPAGIKISLISAAGNVTISRAGGFGGELFHVDGLLTFQSQEITSVGDSGSVTIDGSGADAYGSLIYISGSGVLGMDGSLSLLNNHSSGNGGAIYNSTSGTLVIYGGTIAGNSAASGGAIYSETSILISGNADVIGNYDSDGNADNIALAAGNAVFVETTLSDASIGVHFADRSSGANIIYLTEEAVENGATIGSTTEYFKSDDSSLTITPDGILADAESVSDEPEHSEANAGEAEDELLTAAAGPSLERLSDVEWVDESTIRTECVSDSDGVFFAAVAPVSSGIPTFDVNQGGTEIQADQPFEVVVSGIETEEAATLYVLVKSDDGELSPKGAVPLDMSARPTEEEETEKEEEEEAAPAEEEKEAPAEKEKTEPVKEEKAEPVKEEKAETSKEEKAETSKEEKAETSKEEKATEEKAEASDEKGTVPETEEKAAASAETLKTAKTAKTAEPEKKENETASAEHAAEETEESQNVGDPEEIGSEPEGDVTPEPEPIVPKDSDPLDTLLSIESDATYPISEELPFTVTVKGANSYGEAAPVNGDTRWVFESWSIDDYDEHTEHTDTGTDPVSEFVIHVTDGITISDYYIIYVTVKQQMFVDGEWLPVEESDPVTLYRGVNFQLPEVTPTTPPEHEGVDQTIQMEVDSTFIANLGMPYDHEVTPVVLDDTIVSVEVTERYTSDEYGDNKYLTKFTFKGLKAGNTTVDVYDGDAVVWRYEITVTDKSGSGDGEIEVTPTTRAPHIADINDSEISGISNLKLMPNTFYPFTVTGAGTDNTNPVTGDTRWVPQYWRMESGTTQQTTWRIGAKAGINEVRTIPIRVYLQEQRYNSSTGQWEATGVVDYITANVTTTTYTQDDIKNTTTDADGNVVYQNGKYYGSGSGDDDSSVTKSGSTSDVGSGTAKGAKTGDDSPIVPLVILAAGSLLLVAIIVILRKRKKVD